MYFFIWFSFLGLATMGFLLRQRTRFWGQSLLGTGTLGCLGLIAWQVYQGFFAHSEISRDRYHAVIAYTMGHQVARELAGRPGKICLILPPESVSSSDALDTLYETFARVLRPFSALEIKEAALRVNAKLLRNGQIPISAFEQALAEVPDAIAYVSFAGVPKEAQTLSVFSKPEAPLLFVYDPSGSTNWSKALEKRLIRRVIVPRPDAKVPKKGTIVGPPEEIFKEHFLLATPETADKIASRLADR